MKVVNEWPPNIADLRPHFELSKDVVFCYGDTIYNPHNLTLRDDLIYHESIHTVQQGDDIEGWWERYITDVLFRFDQEAEAYGKQIKYIRQQRGARDAYRAAHFYARSLAGPIYGKCATEKEAFKTLIAISRQ